MFLKQIKKLAPIILAVIFLVSCTKNIDTIIQTPNEEILLKQSGPAINTGVQSGFSSGFGSNAACHPAFICSKRLLIKSFSSNEPSAFYTITVNGVNVATSSTKGSHEIFFCKNITANSITFSVNSLNGNNPCPAATIIYYIPGEPLSTAQVNGGDLCEPFETFWTISENCDITAGPLMFQPFF